MGIAQSLSIEALEYVNGFTDRQRRIPDAFSDQLQVRLPSE